MDEKVRTALARRHTTSAKLVETFMTHAHFYINKQDFNFHMQATTAVIQAYDETKEDIPFDDETQVFYDTIHSHLETLNFLQSCGLPLEHWSAQT